ncbi:DNA-binding transcriptional LysR family regulator [Breznakia sp. PF5-3]|uniref:LysR family transcriptional regulator n=1 Tax=unclassified Breznakia TaxID=2623764 RepID=UPI0024074635|nr:MULTISPECIES: LysR family transcriptional regulator [unclassified Breznakia]MDF9824529.1 DNA-binding transcriptional LysR family regulator [Breznakia sp. PM6-1]MDF9835315.1 DNA-binding transcriptional LysR family regulator [Breznakia sp. PF5-3]MDF9837031.1 DNA-binding transcriptional LysR family regulator [Breznakia sp. PFB2-8]MDF9858956.1 DNA-binding transcriptional LysR family regulator [Breznakia sp. PH5-24]
MEIRNMKAFLNVAELQSFTKAAELSGYSQSAITVQIKQLEKELGVQLFERIGKQVKLTNYGETFLQQAIVILKEIEIAKEIVHTNEAPAGNLDIGVIESLSTSVLPDILIEFQQKYPHVSTTIKTGLNSEMYEMIKNNQIDLIYFLDEKLNFPKWIKVLEKEEPIVFVTSSKNPFLNHKDITLQMVLEEPLILSEKGLSYRYDLEQYLASKNMELHPVLEIGNTDVILKLILNNYGISFLPYYVVQELVEQGELTILDIKEVNVTMWSQVVYHKNKLLTPQMKAFIDMLKEHTKYNE